MSFVVQPENKGVVIPVDVQPKENRRSRALRAVTEGRSDLKGLRLSMSPARDEDSMANLPLYAVSALDFDAWPAVRMKNQVL